MDRQQLHPVFRQMPDDWPILRIDDLFTIQQGKQVSARQRDGNRQRPFLRTRNVYWGRLDLRDLDAMHFSEEDEQRLRLLPGDLLTCEGGWVGRTALWNGEAKNCLYQNHLHRLRRFSPDLDPRFALYWLWYAFEIGEVYFGRHNVTTIPNLSKSRLGELPMPSPEASEQRGIATVLSRVQRAIERQERMLALTDELKRTLFHKLFTEGTRGEPLQQTDLGPMPQSWEVKSVGDVCKLISGGTPSKANTTFWNGTIPWVSPKDMKQSRLYDAEDHISQTGLDEGSRLVPAGSVFVVIRGMILMRDVPIALASVPTAFNQDLKALVANDRISPDFLLYSLQRSRELLLQKVGSSAHGTRTLMTTTLEELPIGIPGDSEQHLISQALKLAEAKEIIHRRTQERLQELFRTLLHQLMTAQIRVHDVDLSKLETQIVAREPAGAA